MQAPRIETQTLPPPPGIVGSLRTGFDAIASNVAVILLPLALDLLLWLGPHLSLERLMKPVLTSNFNTLVSVYGFKAEDIKGSVDASSQAGGAAKVVSGGIIVAQRTTSARTINVRFRVSGLIGFIDASPYRDSQASECGLTIATGPSVTQGLYHKRARHASGRMDLPGGIAA